MKTEPNQSVHPIQATLYNEFGLTKREYFAAMIIQGQIASGLEFAFPEIGAVQIADRLIEELNKPVTP